MTFALYKWCNNFKNHCKTQIRQQYSGPVFFLFHEGLIQDLNWIWAVIWMYQVVGASQTPKILHTDSFFNLVLVNMLCFKKRALFLGTTFLEYRLKFLPFLFKIFVFNCFWKQRKAKTNWIWPPNFLCPVSF